MSITEGPILDETGKMGKREFVIRGTATFPFIVNVLAENEEEAEAFVEGMELTDLLVGKDEEEYDEVNVKEVIPFE